jgi:hypothetical protein
MSNELSAQAVGSGVNISIVLPIGDESRGMLARVVDTYAECLDASAHSWEILVVPAKRAAMVGLRDGELTQIANVRICPACDGWGAAVTDGLRASAGQLVCYTNWQRTSAKALAEMLSLALRNQDVVVRANRRTRDTRVGRLGSLLYNLECRLLLQVSVWDVNGTPKIFPRAFTDLFNLQQTGDLLDAEFAAVCERSGYPVIEVPIEAPLHSDSSDSFDLLSALRLYIGVVRLRSRLAR